MTPKRKGKVMHEKTAGLNSWYRAMPYASTIDCQTEHMRSVSGTLARDHVGHAPCQADLWPTRRKTHTRHTTHDKTRDNTQDTQDKTAQDTPRHDETRQHKTPQTRDEQGEQEASARSGRGRWRGGGGPGCPGRTWRCGRRWAASRASSPR
eukprot:1684903-Rhodomonas_salina.4